MKSAAFRNGKSEEKNFFLSSLLWFPAYSNDNFFGTIIEHACKMGYKHIAFVRSRFSLDTRLCRLGTFHFLRFHYSSSCAIIIVAFFALFLLCSSSYYYYCFHPNIVRTMHKLSRSKCHLICFYFLFNKYSWKINIY